MKTKVARKIAKSAANGTVYPIHILRAAARQLQRPLVVDTAAGDFTYFPKGLKGKFVNASQYRPVYRFNIILPVGSDLTAFKGRNGHVREIDLEAGQHRLSVGAGSGIDGTCRAAVQLAYDLRMVVPFNFNDAEVVAHPNSDPLDMLAGWQAELDRKRQEYLASDEYKAMKAEQDAANARDQATIDRLISELVEATNDREKLLTWLSDFAAIADNMNLTYPKTIIANTIRTAGYVSGAWVGQKDVIDVNKDAEAEYIIGQALSCLDGDMPPHPVLVDFVKRYRGEKTAEEVYKDEFEDSDETDEATV